MHGLSTLISVVGQAGVSPELAGSVGGGINLGPVVFRLIGSMILILFLIFVLVMLFRRYGRNLSPQTAMGRHVSVLGTYSIEAKKRIYLVRVFDRVILMGAGPMGLTALAEFEGEDVEERMKAVENVGAKPVEDFRQLFKKLSANMRSLKGAESS